jgi:hypothetical protein
MLSERTMDLARWHRDNSAGTEPVELHRQMLVTLGALASELGKKKPDLGKVREKVAVLAGGAWALTGEQMLSCSSGRHTQEDLTALLTASTWLGDIGDCLANIDRGRQAAARLLGGDMLAWLERLEADGQGSI